MKPKNNTIKQIIIILCLVEMVLACFVIKHYHVPKIKTVQNNESIHPIQLGGFIACANDSIELVTSFKYRRKGTFSDNRACVITEKRKILSYFKEREARVAQYGFIDNTGKEVIRPQFDYADDFSHGVAVVQKNNKWGVIDTVGNYIVPLEYDKIVRVNNNVFMKVRKGDLWGYYIDTNSFLIAPEYSLVNDFSSDGLASVKMSELGCWRFIDSYGNYINDILYDSIVPSDDGLYPVKKEGLWGFFDGKRKRNIGQIEFSEVYKFSNGFAKVRKDTLWGVVDTTGSLIIAPAFFSVVNYLNGFTYAQKESKGKYYVINRKGDVIVESDKIPTITKSQNIIYALSNENYILADSMGKTLTSEKYSYINSLLRGELFKVKTPEGYYGLIDDRGFKITEPIYQELNDFDNNGLAMVKRKGSKKYTMIDKGGNVVWKEEYDEIYSIGSGYYKIRKGSLWGIIDAAGQEINIPRCYNSSDILQYNGYFFTVKIGEDVRFYNTLGEAIRKDVKYSNSILGFVNGYAAVKEGDVWGFIDTLGREVVKPQFDIYSNFGKDGKAWVGYNSYHHGSEVFCIDTTGKYTLN